MKTIFDHIDTVKAQPHHIREKVAFGVAGAAAGIVALAWFFGVFATGTFAIADTSFAQSSGVGGAAVAAVAPQDTNYGVAGAAAAIPSSAEAPAGIEIVDAPAKTTPAASDRTYIPF